MGNQEVSTRKVIVTGGSNGIGRAIGERFLAEGADVTVFDMEEPPYGAEYSETDVRKQKEVKMAFRGVCELDVLVNNAGLYHRTPADVFEDELFYELFETNVKGYRLAYTYGLPLLTESEEGSVVNVSSGLSKRPEPESDLYSATKSAVNTMKTSWANSYPETGVRANAVLPGPVETEMLTEALTKEELEKYESLQPQGRLVQPEEVAEAVLFLTQNPTHNGAELEVGGETHQNQYGIR